MVKDTLLDLSRAYGSRFQPHLHFCRRIDRRPPFRPYCQKTAFVSAGRVPAGRGSGRAVFAGICGGFPHGGAVRGAGRYSADVRGGAPFSFEGFDCRAEGRGAGSRGADIRVVYNIAWYEQKAVIVLLALLSLGVKDIHLGPTLPAFLSPNVVKVLVDMFHIAGIGSVEDDLKKFGL